MFILGSFPLVSVIQPHIFLRPNGFFFSYMSRPSVHMKPVNLLTKNRVYLKPLSREVKGPSTLIRVTKWLCSFKNARIHVDGALNWSYFLNNYIIGSCLFLFEFIPQVHRTLMIITLLLTITATILIFVHVEGWSSVSFFVISLGPSSLT